MVLDRLYHETVSYSKTTAFPALKKKAKKMRFRMGRSKLIRKAKLFLQEWDGTAEALADTLRYTVE